MRPLARLVMATALLLLQVEPARSQETATEIAPETRPRKVPWAVGEYLEYSVKFGFLTAGSGRMQVTGIDTVRGHTVWRLHFNVSGGIPFVHVNDTYDSWMDVETLNSLRFVQDLSEAGSRHKRKYEIFPGRAMYSLNGEAEEKSVENPLDDASFFFFVRSIPLEVGETYEFHRYFNPKSNPVVIRVLRKDTVEVPAGRFPAIVIQPLIKSGGLFGEGGHAEIWLSDDNRRILLQMKTRLSVGSLNLYLKKYNHTQEVVPPPGKTP